MNGKRVGTAAVFALCAGVLVSGCDSAASKGAAATPTAVTSAPVATASATADPTTAAGVTTPAATATSLPMPAKLKLPAGTIDPAKLPPADAAIVAVIAAGPNKRFDVNYLATIDQAARTRDTAALDRLIGCQAGGKCAADDKLWAQDGVLDQIPLLLEQATIGQDSGQLYVPEFTGPSSFAANEAAADKKLLGVAYPSEYRGLVLDFQAGGGPALTWGSADLQQAPSSTVRLAGLTTVTAANMPKADPAILAKVQAATDNGKALTVPANLVALVLEAAQDKDIDALLKLCQPCNQDQTYKTRFIDAITKEAIPYDNGRFDELAQALLTHPAPANGKTGLFYPGYDQTWIKPAPSVDAADKAKYLIGHMQGVADIQTEFAVLDDGQVPNAAWMGLTNLP